MSLDQSFSKHFYFQKFQLVLILSIRTTGACVLPQNRRHIFIGQLAGHVCTACVYLGRRYPDLLGQLSGNFGAANFQG